MKPEINIGFGHTVKRDWVVAMLMPGSLPLKRLRDRAQQECRLVDATSGRRTRAIIITDSNYVILSAVAPETLWRRAGAAELAAAVAGAAELAAAVQEAACYTS